MYISRHRFSLGIVLEKIERDGFAWADFQEVFPFGFLDIHEGDHVDLVNAALDSLPDDRQREAL